MTVTWSDDFRDLLVELHLAGAEFLIVGGYAVGAHGVERATKDLDIFVGADPANAPRVMAALRAFGAPVGMHGVSEADFATAQMVYQMGLPPNRVDLLTSISGVDFAEAWARRSSAELDGLTVPLISLEDLLRNKRAAGRIQDMADVELLERLRGG